MCYFDLSADWLWAALGGETTFHLWLLFFSPGVNKPDFDPSLLQILLLSSMLSHWAPQPGGGRQFQHAAGRHTFLF